MQTLLNMFNEEEKELINTSNQDLETLKEIHETRKGKIDQEEFKFEMKTIFSSLRETKTREIQVREDKTREKTNLEFNPTISRPDITVTDKEARSYSIWYQPIIYVPSKNSAKKIQPDFIVIKGERESIYKKYKELKKSLYTYEFLSDSVLKETSSELLKKMHSIQLAIHANKEYKYKDLTGIKNSKHYLEPENLLLVSEKELPEDVKMNLPVGVTPKEKVGINLRKLQGKTAELLE